MKKALIALCIFTILGSFAWKLSEGRRKEKAHEEQLLATSDAKVFSRTFHVQGDEWLGYCIFKSKEMQDDLAAQDIGLVYEIEPDFSKRVENLADGKIDIAAMTIDTWLVNGKDKDYPGVIGFIIDESNGGDAIIGGPNVKNINDLRRPGIKGAFVGYSPSEFLIKSAAAHFQLEGLKKRLSGFRVDRIEDAYGKLRRGEVDFAVLWEPQVSQALQSIRGSSRLIDTSKVQGIITDVAVFSRRIVKDDPKMATAVTQAYFKALHHYLNRPEEFQSLASAYSKTSATDTRKMLSGIAFASFGANQNTWYGTTSTTSGKLASTIQDVTDILIQVGDMAQDPLNGNPHTIVNSRILGSLVNNQGIEKLARETELPARIFNPLTAEEWNSLADNPVGTLIEQPILFKRGTTEIEEESQDILNAAAQKITHYPRYRIVIEASVSQGSSQTDDDKLSQERADALGSWFVTNANIDQNRIHALGLGSRQLPPQLPDENDKAWERRCRYAKLLLVADK